MRKLSVPSKMLKAAQCCQAKNDVRYYLNGIHIKGKHVEATNGHVAIRCHADKIISKKPAIVNIKGKVPARSATSVFEFNGDQSLVKHFDEMNIMIGCHPFESIDGNYPDFDRVIPSKTEPTEFFGINIDYMALPKKCFGSRSLNHCKVSMHGNEKSIMVELVGAYASDYGNAKLLIMPARL